MTKINKSFFYVCFSLILLITIYGNGGNSTYAKSSPSITYSTHVQSYGWMNTVKDGALSGTIGKSKRVEAIKIALKNAPYSGGISYKTHVQSYGWMNTVSNGAISGTSGKSKRVEAIQINLTGEMAKHYDVYYRVHTQSYGWLDWAKNGQSAGTEGFSKRVEALEIVLVEKGGKAPGATNKPFVAPLSVTYSTHVQSYGWMNNVKNGATSGTTGKGKRVEAIKILLENAPYSGGISYKTHVQSYGWMNSVQDGELSGTSGKSKRVEAIQMSLTGEMAEYYDVYYRVNVQSYGWLDWAKNGESAGTEGFSKRVEAIQIKLVEKGQNAPGSTAKPFISKPSIVYSSYVQSNGWTKSVKDGALSGTEGQSKRLEGLKIDIEDSPYDGEVIYSTKMQSNSWAGNSSSGNSSGMPGQTKPLEAVKINLSGEIANYYDIYYRLHVQSYGWLGWAKNGMKAGTVDLFKQAEAIEIKLVEKNKGDSVSEKNSYKTNISTTKVNYNISLSNALTMQMKVLPQTDKYKNSKAYVSSTYLKMLDKGIIKENNVYFRTSPSIKDDKNISVKNIKSNTSIIVLDKKIDGEEFSGSKTWYKIEYKDKELYVHSSLVKLTTRIGRALEDGLNIRSEKNSTSHIYGTVKKGTDLTVLQESGNWFEVSYNAWRNAKSSDVEYYLNPANFTSDKIQRFQFMDLTKTSNVPVSVLNQYLKGKGILDGKGQAFIDAGKEYGINEVYLMAHALLETGNGTSTLAKGVNYNGKTVYNMYGVGALDSCPNECGTKTAYENGWTSPEKAIIGGAEFIVNGYLNGYTDKEGNHDVKIIQNTLYKMRWNPQKMTLINRYGTSSANHQYATDIGWAYKQVKTMAAVYDIRPFIMHLEIPVYK